MANDVSAGSELPAPTPTPTSKTVLPEGIIIRRAVQSDAEAIANVHHTSWQEAYPGRIPQEIFESVTLARRLDQWGRGLAPRGPYAAGGNVACFVAVDTRDAADAEPHNHSGGGRVVGFVTAGEPQPRDDGVAPQLPEGTREVLSLYVLARVHGTGVARALVDAAIPPSSPAVVWMLDNNPRARAFYAKCGFVLDITRWDARRPGSEILERRMLRGCGNPGGETRSL